MKQLNLIAFELLLLCSSVLVFRSLWAFLDRTELFNTVTGLGILLAFGLLGFIIALMRLNKKTF